MTVFIYERNPTPWPARIARQYTMSGAVQPSADAVMLYGDRDRGRGRDRNFIVCPCMSNLSQAGYFFDGSVKVSEIGSMVE